MSELTIMVNRSSLHTFDTSQNQTIVLSEKSINTAFTKNLNQTIQEHLDVTLNKTRQFIDTFDIEGTDTETCFQILWSQKIATMEVLMGEVEFSFDVPISKIFSGLRENSTGYFFSAHKPAE